MALFTEADRAKAKAARAAAAPLPSRAKAIAAKCRDCIFDEAAAGTAAQQIQACASVDCPLWPVRPCTATTINATLVAEQGLDDELARELTAAPRDPGAWERFRARGGSGAT